MLNELEQAAKILEGSRYPEDVFGDLESADKTSKELLLEQEVRALRVSIHPDKHPAESDRATLLTQRLVTWQEIALAKIKAGIYGDRSAITPVVIKTKHHTWKLDHRLVPGDVCNIYTGKGGLKSAKHSVVVKVALTPANNPLVLHEVETINLLQTAPANVALAGLRHYIPKVMDTFTFRSSDKTVRQGVVLQQVASAVSAADIIQAYPKGIDSRDAAWMFNRILGALAYAHARGVIHAQVLPEHVLFDLKAHGAVLIDWTMAVKRGDIVQTISLKNKAAYPAEVLAKRPIDEGLDTYMAAGIMQQLLGQQPVPAAMIALLKACRFGPGRRYNDAFEIHDEFRRLLGRLYGTPKFRHFTMPEIRKS